MEEKAKDALARAINAVLAERSAKATSLWLCYEAVARAEEYARAAGEDPKIARKKILDILGVSENEI